MSREVIVYVDSNQRDVAMYPTGSSYTLHLPQVIRNITKVDLVSAFIPNTMYNLTVSNAFQVDSTTIYFNPGFYTTCSITSTFNSTLQVPAVTATMAYLASEGRFIWYGSFSSITILTNEFAQLVGLPLGTTAAQSISSNPVYSKLYPTATNYVKSRNVISLGVNEYIWLDIAEFRTPLTTDARQLIKQSYGQYTTSGNTAATSFALVPMDVNSGSFKAFKENEDYRISVEFPSRIESLDRLTINWRDRNGQVLNFNGLETNSLAIRLHTIVVPTEPERIESLPPPVAMDDKRKIMFITGAVLTIGLFIILFTAHRRR